MDFTPQSDTFAELQVNLEGGLTSGEVESQRKHHAARRWEAGDWVIPSTVARRNTC